MRHPAIRRALLCLSLRPASATPPPPVAPSSTRSGPHSPPPNRRAQPPAPYKCATTRRRTLRPAYLALDAGVDRSSASLAYTAAATADDLLLLVAEEQRPQQNSAHGRRGDAGSRITPRRRGRRWRDAEEADAKADGRGTHPGGGGRDQGT